MAYYPKRIYTISIQLSVNFFDILFLILEIEVCAINFFKNKYH